jgi:hypothetical protein
LSLGAGSLSGSQRQIPGRRGKDGYEPRQETKGMPHERYSLSVLPIRHNERRIFKHHHFPRFPKHGPNRVAVCTILARVCTKNGVCGTENEPFRTVLPITFPSRKPGFSYGPRVFWYGTGRFSYSLEPFLPAYARGSGQPMPDGGLEFIGLELLAVFPIQKGQGTGG